MKVKIRYFSILRDKAGMGEELIDTLGKTPLDIYKELDERHHFHLQTESIKVAINAEFCQWNSLVNANDELVFITPVAGG